MTHFNNKPRKWQHFEIEVLHIEMKKGSTIEQILRLLPHRTYSSVDGRIRWEKMTRDQKDANNVRVAICRRNKRDLHQISKARRSAAPFINTAAGARPPASVLMARDERLGLTHRDVTAAFFGDPLPGYSALDRRQ